MIAHATVKDVRSNTEHYLVFQQHDGGVSLVKQVEVPRYSQPNSSGVQLDQDKKLSLAVARAVESDESYLQAEPFEGELYAVLTELGADEFEFVEYEQNPAFDAVWDPESEANRSHVSESERSDDDSVWDPEENA